MNSPCRLLALAVLQQSMSACSQLHALMSVHATRLHAGTWLVLLPTGFACYVLATHSEAAVQAATLQRDRLQLRPNRSEHLAVLPLLLCLSKDGLQPSMRVQDCAAHPQALQSTASTLRCELETS